MMNVFSMLFDYEDRKVARDEFEWGFISTIRVTDGRQPYETAVAHSAYRDAGKMVVVQAYDTLEQAVAGHAAWVSIITAEDLPEQLEDCCNAECAQILQVVSGGSVIYKRRS